MKAEHRSAVAAARRMLATAHGPREPWVQVARALVELAAIIDDPNSSDPLNECCSLPSSECVCTEDDVRELLTAYTITDEQIRGLLADLAKQPSPSGGLLGPNKGIPACWDALNKSTSAAAQWNGRRECAEILNARTGASQ